MDESNRIYFLADMTALCLEDGIECPAASSLKQYADTYQRWTRTVKGRREFVGPDSTPWSVLMELRMLPERFQLVKDEPSMTIDRAKAHVKKSAGDVRALIEIEQDLARRRRAQSGRKKATRPHGEPMDEFVKRLDNVIQEWRVHIKRAIEDGELVEDEEVLEEARRHVERLAKDLVKLEAARV